jgi:hypothetical protein
LAAAALLVCAWIVDVTFVFTVWPQGVVRLRDLLASELECGVALAFRQTVSPVVITAPANLLYSIVFEATGVHDMGMRFARQHELTIPDTIAQRGYQSTWEVLEAIMVGTQLLGVRVAIVARFAPLILLLYLVLAANGLSQRAIRRVCGGRESAGGYKLAKLLHVALLGLGGIGLLLWPGAVWWELCVPTGAVLTSGLAGVQCAYYKKHL